MRTRVALALAAALMLLISLAAVGSNMGFKILITIPANQNIYVAVPYYCTLDGHQVELGSAYAANLRNDITAAGGSNVSVYNFSGTSWQRYSGGGFGQVNFALVSGTGYEVVSGAQANWVVVGSHNPSLVVTIQANQNTYVAPPYHTTSSNAALLRNEILAAGGSSVSLYNFNGTSWQRYSGGGFGQVNFAITPGLAYQVVSGSQATWTPSHY
jgi:coproporphyrinogen III oxidase